jgi:serine/threonine-protein kinase RsbW
MVSRVSRTFSGELSELRPMSAWLRHAVAESGVEDRVAWAAELCLNEVAANIIMYAYDDDARAHPITVEIEHSNHALRMIVIDGGRPFNPLDVAPVGKPESLEDAPTSGMGIQLVRSCASDVRYQREPLQNVLTLTFE